jgi:Holliday junction resolvase-like predicted endonuclease
MRDHRQLVVVEVRYRHGVTPVSPAASIGSAKRERISRATECFLQQHPGLNEHAVRFDVVAVSGSLIDPTLRWLPAAFDCSDRT